MEDNKALAGTIKAYLKEVLECEAELIGLRKGLAGCEQTMSVLGNPHAMPNEPIRVALPSVNQDAPDGRYITADELGSFSTEDYRIGAIGIGGLAGTISGLFSMDIGIIVLFAILGLVIGAILGNSIVGKAKGQAQAYYLQRVHVHDMEQQRYDEEYQCQMEAYRQSVRDEETRLEDERARKAELEVRASEIRALIKETEAILARLYSVGIIHQKYRDITAVASFHDYFDTGRTSSLQRNGGDPGAYNIYEEDLRAGRIISAIDYLGERIDFGFASVSQHLETMKANQYALYGAISESNALSGRLIDNVTETNAKLTENTEYLEVVQKHARILLDLKRDHWGALHNLDGDIVDETRRR